MKRRLVFSRSFAHSCRIDMSDRSALKPPRDPNLDLLRAIAIAIVVLFHIGARWPFPRPWLVAATAFGERGVDLFFVLSGWLIGGLLWREWQRFGSVEAGRFILRRMLRTVPPYLVVLALSFVAVSLTRGATFDWRYLVFLQNYRLAIPFFHVSWSLCVEEHFYLLMPFAVVALRKLRWSPGASFLAVAALPILFRAAVWAGPIQPFGYFFTATHLRFEGLLLGVWASHLHAFQPEGWARWQRFADWAAWPAIALAVGTATLPGVWSYSLFYSAVSWLFLLWLSRFVGRPAGIVAASPVTRHLALCSYSIYLTHTFVEELVLRVLARWPVVPEILLFPLMLACMGVAGVVFHAAVEKPSLALRRRLVPDRT